MTNDAPAIPANPAPGHELTRRLLRGSMYPVGISLSLYEGCVAGACTYDAIDGGIRDTRELKTMQKNQFGQYEYVTAVVDAAINTSNGTAIIKKPVTEEYGLISDWKTYAEFEAAPILALAAVGVGMGLARLGQRLVDFFSGD